MKILKLLVVLLVLISGAAALFLFEDDIPKDVIDAKYSNHSSQFITLENQSRIHFRDEGNRSGQPVVLIHGFGASLHTWSPWVKLLGDEFRIVTLDLPAHRPHRRRPWRRLYNIRVYRYRQHAG